MSHLTATTQWHQRAEKLFLSGNYIQAANIYEEAIAVEPEIKLHYWYLGLMLLLLGQDAEARKKWLLAVQEEKAEKIKPFKVELFKILQTEAERRESLEEYYLAKKIRLILKEIYPHDIHNLLHLVQLAIKLETYEGESLYKLGIIEILQSEPRVELNLEWLMKTVKSVLDYAPAHQSTLDLVEACVPHCQNDPAIFLITLLLSLTEIAYSQRLPIVAAKLCEISLRLSPNNPEFVSYLSQFYQHAGQYTKGIEAAKLFYSLVQKLVSKVYANRLILSGLISSGGYWSESYSIHQRQKSLIADLIKENPTNLDSKITKLISSSNFFTPYIEDKGRETRQMQNQLLQLCQTNINNYAQEHINKYKAGHLQRKKYKQSHKKLNIGYLSSCLRIHSVGWLARWLLQYRNKDKFNVSAYFINTNPKADPLHDWYINQVDSFYKSSEPLNLVEQIYQDEIDILVDLDSVTLDITCEVIGLKPAPIQVTWLGWDASGSPSVDYFIADPYVLPKDAQEYYQEKIIRLPQTYIAVDGFEVNVPTIRREHLDIPDDAIVYFSGQRGLKRHPNTTRMQLQIIKEVPNSYLLIKGVSDAEFMKQFFEKLAQEVGVDCSKLRFIPMDSVEPVHRANLGIADVVLDTYPYNGATTTLETLWMCLPLVTRVGEQFAARNSYTMMMNAGITEGIAWTDEEYVNWGVRLGKDEALRQHIAWKLKQSRKTSPLWNGKQFARDMENAYQEMWHRYLEGN
ncbi:O-linked N-acetylglucosamine transferase, SPINDLY family protein [Nostoc sp. TCL26-01]|uniref:O-linked N-acetylglucosamine transferase, SPINDLY family protein n=1 Tax=Nostoc sp. TCL26-01 TaxID=2576904 RepID=UPI0015BA827C|nr:O-linked N-acetylglucosamine transferase, SPINDLY family protein [Nostoc sp. TCL26-01]QLE54766.1 O-linked N-acetylglucosamine transferase, SPINDLY family protein [Nostoc sp. TCL26-01]